MQSVADTFTRVAEGYDRLNRILSLGLDVLWRRSALAALAGGLPKGGSGVLDILDLATGTADFAIAAAHRFPEAHVIGLDLTPAMLEIGARKVEKAGLARRIDLMPGDATALPFAAASFDVALCAFGFRNFPDMLASLSEVARILRNGGQLVALEFFRPRSALLGAFTSGWLKTVSALFAKGRAADYAYLRTSIARTCSAGEFAAMAREVGLTPAMKKFFFPACTCLILKKCDKIQDRLGKR